LNIDIDADQITVFSKIAEKARHIEKSDPVNMLIQDLKYLIEMKRLENVQTNEKLLHIVPIGGLVLNNFHRQWNELKTVIELWGHREHAKKESAQPPETNTNNHVDIRASTGLEEKSNGRTLLHQKVLDNELDDVAKLLVAEDSKEMLNRQDPYGWTPLHCCCHSGNLDMCKLLLSQEDTAVHLENTDGNTPLHYLVRHAGSVDTIQLLLARKADPNAKNSHAETALHYACMRGHEEIVSFLLKNGADPNALNTDGDACLHYAVFVGKPEIVKLLLKYGAKRDVISKKQGSPLDIAIKFKLSKIVSLFKEEAE
jgi:ankyrin repeat protein